MKVLRIITRLNIGGPAIHAALLSTQLDAGRFPTCLVAGTPQAGEGDLSGLVRGGAVRLVRLSTLVRPIRPWADARTLIALLRILWAERPQVIHTHLAKAGALGRLAAFLYNGLGPGRAQGARAAVLHTFHGHVLEGYFSPALSRAFLAVERWLARRTDCLIAVSPAIREELLGRKRIGRPAQWRVIPLGVDLSALAALPSSDGDSPVRIGLVGRLVPIKNPGLFLEAVARLAPQTAHPVRGVMVGDGPLRPALERHARRLGLEQAVRFAGWQQALPSVYGALDIVCLTSWNEGTPVSVIEAMASSRAVVATDVGGVRDLLDDGQGPRQPVAPGTFHLAARGMLVRPGDAQGLAAALRVMVEDAALRRRLGQAARAYAVASFAPERLVRDMAACYEELMAGRQR